MATREDELLESDIDKRKLLALKTAPLIAWPTVIIFSSAY